MRRYVLALATFQLAACTVGPNYKEPQIAVPSAFQGLPAQADMAIGQDGSQTADLSNWWKQFNDPELERLIDRALSGNLDLKTALSRIRQAREQQIVQAATGLPSVNATASAVRLHSNSNPLSKLAGGNAGGTPGGTDLKLYSAGFDASWEIDVFGGVRRSIEMATATTESAEWGLRDVEVSLGAEVASEYLSLRTTQARIALVEAELQRQRDTLDIVRARATTGFVTELDINQQTAQVEATAALLPLLQGQLRVDIDALAILLGAQPESMSAEFESSAAIPEVSQGLPIGLPSDLMRRRPDIREAERNLAAATAGVGVAVSQLYPKFNILALASFAGTSLSSLFSSDNLGEGGAGLIRWPVFTGGKTEANIHIAEEQQNQAYLAYQKAILRGLGDVEDALAHYTSEQQRLNALQQSATAANSSVTIAADQYRTGFTTYLNVLTAQTTLLQIQDEEAQSRSALATDLVALYKALGGGWS